MKLLIHGVPNGEDVITDLSGSLNNQSKLSGFIDMESMEVKTVLGNESLSNLQLTKSFPRFVDSSADKTIAEIRNIIDEHSVRTVKSIELSPKWERVDKALLEEV